MRGFTVVMIGGAVFVIALDQQGAKKLRDSDVQRPSRH